MNTKSFAPMDHFLAKVCQESRSLARRVVKYLGKRREHTSLTPLFFQCFESVNILIGIDPEGQRAATVSR